MQPTTTPTTHLSVNAAHHDDGLYEYDTMSVDGMTVRMHMDEWVDNFKSALAQHVRQAFLKPLDENAERLSMLRDASGAPVFPRFLLEYEWDPETRALEVATSRAAQLLIHRENDQALLESLLQSRRDLERFLVVRRRRDAQPFPKGYVLKRLRTLCGWEGDPPFASFAWAGGESWQGVPFSSKTLPTDAELVFRAVCVWMDDLLRHDDSPDFSIQHVRDVGSSSSRELAELKTMRFWGFLNCGHTSDVDSSRALDVWSPTTSLLAATATTSSSSSSFRPLFKVALDGRVLHVKPGRENVFHAVVLFLLVLRRNRVAGLEPILTKVFKSVSATTTTNGPSASSIGGVPMSLVSAVASTSPRVGDSSFARFI